MGNPAWRSDRHESGLGKPVIHGPGRRADSGDLLLVWLQEQLSLLVVAREAARSMEDGEAGVGIFVDLDAGLDEVSPVGLLGDLQDEALVADRIVVLDLAAVLDGEDDRPGAALSRRACRGPLQAEDRADHPQRGQPPYRAGARQAAAGRGGAPTRHGAPREAVRDPCDARSRRKPSQRVSESQSHAKLSPPAQVAVFCAALWPNLQPALTDDPDSYLNLDHPPLHASRR